MAQSNGFQSGSRIPVKVHKSVCMMRVADPILAEELLARKAIARCVVGRLSETVLLIRAETMDALLAELRQIGQAPRVAGRKGRIAER